MTFPRLPKSIRPLRESDISLKRPRILSLFTAIIVLLSAFWQWSMPPVILGQEASPTPAAASSTSKWNAILGPSQGTWATPRAKVIWLDNMIDGLRQSKNEKRPLFVTLRCLPCKQCAAFDKDVLEGGPTLSPLLRQFVTVRLTNMRDLDLRLFPIEKFQDLDLSWWGWFLSPAGRLYGVYGGRDEVSDETRISIKSLKANLRRVLDHHYDPRRTHWNVDGPLPALQGKPITPIDLPGWKSWAGYGAKEVATAECLHCHQVSEVLRQPAIDAGRFDKTRDFDMWPLPENVGIVLDRDHGLKVRAVLADSPAARSGIRAGDVIGGAGERRLFGQADLRAVLHGASKGPCRLAVVWARGSQVMANELVLPSGWRKTELGWRASVAEAKVGAHPGIPWVHALPLKQRRSLGIEQGTMAMRPWFGQNHVGAAYEAGLRPGQVIIAVDGKSPDIAGRRFRVWFRLRYEPGQRVELTVVDEKRNRRKIAYNIPGHQ